MIWPFTPKSAGTLAKPDQSLESIFGLLPSTSFTVTPSTAMQVPAVQACVRAISEVVGTLPVKVYRRQTEGGKDVDPNHPAHRLVHDDANAWQSAGALRTQLTQDALLHGNGYAFVNRVNGGKPFEIIRLDPAKVTVEYDEASGAPSYRLSPGTVYGWADVIHIQAPAVDGKKGVAPIASGRKAISLAMALEEHAERTFSNRGRRPAGLLAAEGKLSDEAKASLRESYGKAVDTGLFVTGHGVRFTPMAMTSVEAQLHELRQAQTLEICRLFRVPPHLVQSFERATWANASAADLAFLKHGLRPWLRQWKDAYRRTLIADADKDTVVVDFIVDALLEADIGARATAYSQFVTARIMNPNEIRALENLAPYDGGEAFLNPNTTTTEVPNVGPSA